MRRQHPLFSTLSILFTVILLAGLAYGLWRSGGLAFSPGRLSAKHLSGIALQGFISHADFEAQCELCHQPLERPQAELCRQCHGSIDSQLAQKEGTHGLIAEIQDCAACHPDHRGREFDPTLPALAKFDHAKTNFTLTWHQVDWDGVAMDCRDCHTLQGDFDLAPEKCVECHSGQAPEFMSRHLENFGGECQVCHDGQDSLARFDHRATNFRLEKKHAELECAACHGQAVVAARGTPDPFKNTPLECSACHAEPAAHQGMFSPDCAVCHSAAGWKPALWQSASFEHASVTGFSLVRHAQDYDGSSLTCTACHRQSLLSAPAAAFDLQTCVTCHSQDAEKQVFMDEHVALFGTECLACHDGVDRLHGFDHQQVFPLEGSHAPLECAACHENRTFRGTPAACGACHGEPPVHAGFFGLQCQLCHTVDAWHPAQLRYHRFPLAHGDQGELPCTTCHTGAYVEYTCYGCHDHQPEPIRTSHLAAGITEVELPACAACHADGEIH